MSKCPLSSRLTRVADLTRVVGVDVQVLKAAVIDIAVIGLNIVDAHTTGFLTEIVSAFNEIITIDWLSGADATGTSVIDGAS